jgi:hypothetical protein
MRDKDVVQTEGVGSEGGVATGLAFQVTVGAERRLPDCSSRRIRDEQFISIFVEGEAIGH